MSTTQVSKESLGEEIRNSKKKVHRCRDSVTMHMTQQFLFVVVAGQVIAAPLHEVQCDDRGAVTIAAE